MNFKELLKSKRFNCSSLARELNISPATVSLWANGSTEPKAEMIKKIAEICEIDIPVVFNAILETKEQAKVV